MARPFKYREAIPAILKEHPIHPTVEWLHARLRQEHQRVSLATVYRTLKTLVAQGIICELPFGISESRFGLAMEKPHYHFICDQCQRIFDLPLKPKKHLERTVEEDTGHQVRRHTMEFYGVCRECAEAQAACATAARKPKLRRKP